MAGSFGDLLKKAGLAETETPPAPEAETEPETPEDVAFGSKLVVRHSRKGRGGRTVTLVQGIEGGHDAVLDRLKRELGCGGRVEDGEIVLQGDNRERVARWLESQGVKKVVRA